MNIRNRIIGLENVRAENLRASPKNWRTHPEKQKAALEGMLQEVGFAVPVVARRCEDGSLQLIDGHLRVETAEPGDLIPVVVLDVTESEADKLLATIDPLAALAGKDEPKLVQLLHEVSVESGAVMDMLNNLVKKSFDAPPPEPITVQAQYQVLVTFPDEQTQTAFLERCMAEGLSCKSLIS